MFKIIFFDTETTGNTENDFICQIAYKTDDENFTGLYKPPTKIPPEASAVHHITNKMVAEKLHLYTKGSETLRPGGKNREVQSPILAILTGNRGGCYGS